VFPGGPIHRRVQDPREQFRIGPSRVEGWAHPGHHFPLSQCDDFLRHCAQCLLGTDALAGYLVLL